LIDLLSDLPTTIRHVCSFLLLDGLRSTWQMSSHPRVSCTTGDRRQRSILPSLGGHGKLVSQKANPLLRLITPGGGQLVEVTTGDP
jgi:hypothetical protein